MDWFFFILLNAAFFIRPGDLLQSADLPVYNVLMIACLVVSGARVLQMIRSSSQSPVTVCVLGLVVSCILSHLSRGRLGPALADGFYMVKIVPYYLLLIALVDTPKRLRSLIRWLVVFTLVLAALALGHYHGFFRIESLEAVQQADINPDTGEIYSFPRLCSTGVFNDPNDLSMILAEATIASVYFLESTTRGLGRWLWLVPIGVFLYALQLTYSRGGLIGFCLGLVILFHARFGWKKTFAISVVALPVLVALFGGRMTRIDVGNTSDTSQHRIQLWSHGFDLLREAPIFGVGMNTFADRAGLVAHNSFVHTYAELGFVGGTLFAGAFYAAITGLIRLGQPGVAFFDRATMQLRPYVLAMTCSYCACMFSLSRPYTITTYTALGIAAAHLQIAGRWSSAGSVQFDQRFVQRLFCVGIACVLFLYVFVRLFVRWH
jgi:O-antigen ligase